MKEKENCPFEGLTPQEVNALKWLAKDEAQKRFNIKVENLFRNIGYTNARLRDYWSRNMTDGYKIPSERLVRLSSELHDILAILAEKGGLR